MSRRSLIFFLAAYLALRLQMLVRHFDEVAMPNFELGVMGNLARLASEGEIGVPLHEYFDNVGGHLVVGLLAAPLYATLGDSYLTLKLVPLALGAGTLALLVWLLGRLAGKRAAWLGAAIFVLAPPTLFKYSLLAKGNHFDSLLFQLAAYALFCRAHEAPRRVRWLVAAGAAAGFATFVYVGSLIVVAGMLITHVVIVGTRQALRDAAVALAGFTVGIAPLIAIAFAPGGRLLHFLSAKLDAGSFERCLRRATQLVSEILPSSGGWRDFGSISAVWPEALWLGAFAIAWLSLAPVFVRAARAPRATQEERTSVLLLLPAWLYLPLFTLAFSFSTFDFAPYEPPLEIGRYRYLVPHFLFAILLIAAGGARAMRAGGWSSTSGRCACAAATLACLGTLPLLAGRSVDCASGVRYAGSHFPFLANVLFKVSDHDQVTGERIWNHARVAAIVERLPTDVRHGTYVGVGHHMAWVEVLPWLRGLPREPSGLPLAELLDGYPQTAHIDLAFGVGCNLRRVWGGGASEREVVARVLGQIADSGDAMAPFVIEGLCIDFGYPLELVSARDLRRSHSLAELVPTPYRDSWCRGFGRQCGRLWARGLARDVELVRAEARAISAADQPAFWFGIGWGFSESIERADALARLRAEIPAEHRVRAHAGCGAALRHVHARGAELAIAAGELDGLAPDERAAFERSFAWRDYPRPDACWPR